MAHMEAIMALVVRAAEPPAFGDGELHSGALMSLKELTLPKAPSSNGMRMNPRIQYGRPF